MASNDQASDVATYAATVRAQLADLPAMERDVLLEDLEQHLAEVAAEGEGSLVDRLGPPEDYAVELRAAYRAGRHRLRLGPADCGVSPGVATGMVGPSWVPGGANPDGSL